MSDHEHVVLDERVFHAYQDVVQAARWTRPVAGSSLAYYLDRLEMALDFSEQQCTADPYHHRGDA